MSRAWAPWGPRCSDTPTLTPCPGLATNLATHPRCLTTSCTHDGLTTTWYMLLPFSRWSHGSSCTSMFGGGHIVMQLHTSRHESSSQCWEGVEVTRPCCLRLCWQQGVQEATSVQRRMARLACSSRAGTLLLPCSKAFHSAGTPAGNSSRW